MHEITLGEMLLRFRREKRISQSRLSDGVCTVMTLRRYERDERFPDKFIMDCLVERLDKIPGKIEFVTSAQEFLFRILRDEIEADIKSGQFSLAGEKLNAYEKKIDGSDFLHQQYIDGKRGEILTEQKRYREALAWQKKALSCTNRQDVLERGIGRKPISKGELEIVYRIATLYDKLGNQENSGFLFLSLERYLKGLEEQNEKRKQFYPYVLYYRSRMEKERHNQGAALDYLEQAEQMMRREFLYAGLLEIIKDRIVLEREMKILPARIKEEADMVLALEMLAVSDEDGMLTKEGISLWANTEKQK